MWDAKHPQRPPSNALFKLVYLLCPPQNCTILPFPTRNKKNYLMIFSLTCYTVPHGTMHTVSDMYLSLLFYTLLTLEQILLGGSVFHMFSPNSLSLKRYRPIWGFKARPPTSVSLISSLFFVACFSSDLFSAYLVPFHVLRLSFLPLFPLLWCFLPFCPKQGLFYAAENGCS